LAKGYNALIATEKMIAGIKSRTEDFNSQAERDNFLGKEVLQKDV
jgi:hypothetical protein